MIKAIKDGRIIEVTQGAFDGIFSRQGFVKLDEKPEEPELVNVTNEELSEDEKFVKDIQEKPLSQWTKNEVKKFALIKGIDLKGTKNAGEAKERIKPFLGI